LVVGLAVVTILLDSKHDDLHIEGQNDLTRFIVIGSRFGHRLSGLAEAQLVQSIVGSSLKRKSTSSVHDIMLIGVIVIIEKGSSSSLGVGGAGGPLLL